MKKTISYQDLKKLKACRPKLRLWKRWFGTEPVSITLGLLRDALELQLDIAWWIRNEVFSDKALENEYYRRFFSHAELLEFMEFCESTDLYVRCKTTGRQEHLAALILRYMRGRVYLDILEQEGQEK